MGCISLAPRRDRMVQKREWYAEYNIKKKCGISEAAISASATAKKAIMAEKAKTEEVTLHMDDTTVC
jgi:hypothetical protein